MKTKNYSMLELFTATSLLSVSLLSASLFGSYSFAGGTLSRPCPQDGVVSASSSFTSAIGLAGCVRQAIAPLNQIKEEGIKDSKTRAALLEKLSAKEVTLSTIDGVCLDAVWSQYSWIKRDRPTVILFHGNGMILDDMEGYANWYRHHGFNVLLLTIRGYPGSEGDWSRSGEAGVLLDTEAALRYVLEDQKISQSNLIVHGYSLGGAYAAAAGYLDIPVVLDHTFTQPQAVVSHQIADGLSNRFIKFTVEKAMTRLAQSSLQSAIPAGQKVLLGSRTATTDGLNNLKKAQTFQNDMVVFYGSTDELIPQSFAGQLFEARYPAPHVEFREARRDWEARRDEQMLAVPGGHWSPFYESQAASRRYKAFLAEKGFLRKSCCL